MKREPPTTGVHNAGARMQARLRTRTDLGAAAAADTTAALNEMLSDVFAPYVKTKTFHGHMSRPHFRDYHLLLDEHADRPPPRK